MMLNFLWRVSIYKLSHCLNNYPPQFNGAHFFGTPCMVCTACKVSVACIACMMYVASIAGIASMVCIMLLFV